MADSPADLMSIHVRLHLGGYFSSVAEIEGGWRFASSSSIPDFYWNYAYSPRGDERTPQVDDAIRAHASQIDRPAAVWQVASAVTESDSDESWMVLTEASRVRAGSSWRLTESSVADVATLSVFEDAYGSGGSPDDVGYFELPPEYVTALRDAKPPSDIQVRHLIAWSEDEPVGLASVYRDADGNAGLYNVGVKHAYRRRGIGKSVSAAAVSRVLADGSTRVLLQTPSDSAVEEMYRKLGFERVFRATLTAL